VTDIAVAIFDKNGSDVEKLGNRQVGNRQVVSRQTGNRQVGNRKGWDYFLVNAEVQIVFNGPCHGTITASYISILGR